MLEIKEFLNCDNVEKSKLYQRLSCSKNEALILRELCKNYVGANNSLNTFTLLSAIFGEENYAYLDALGDLKTLIERGFVVQNTGFFKSTETKQKSSLALLQSDLSLSGVFLDFLEYKQALIFEKARAYGDYWEYLKDEFERIELYEKLSFVRFGDYNTKLKEEIKTYEKHIKSRLALSKFYNVVGEIFKEHQLSHKEQIIFLALLKEEYTLNNETSVMIEQNFLLSLISENELEKRQNKRLLEEGSPLIDLGFVEYDEYLNSFGELSKSFFISDELLQKLLNSPKKQNAKIKLESLVKEQEIFELIEPSTDINDIIMPQSTKELLQNILRQQDKKVLERLSAWGIKSSKNIEAKIIFYGPAGTGKTMSALSMAKSMKKAVLSFDCSKILSKWVGESEQNVRKIFDTYKKISLSCKQAPILLLNEADQFLSTRIEGGSGSDKMHNQMQNIFLEQIERFSGVLIATTNFLESLDSAFSRRFDVKIEFKKPDFDDRLKMWEKFLPKNATFDKDFNVKTLARYELSGAQILMIVKNTALKAAVSKDGVWRLQDFLDSINKELDSSFDKNKILGFY